MSRGSEAEEGPSSYPGDFDIPPAIACAHCGEVGCEGCAPDEPSSPPDESQRAALPWEEDDQGVLERLVETSEISAVNPSVAFGRLAGGSVGRAMGFAFLCELWAVASFTLLWGLLFYAAFPFAARQMLGSQAALALIGAILVSLITFVVGIHAIWGVGLEWGVSRAGGKADMNRGIRFGLYACGWDLLTSPAGLWFQLRRAGLRQGLAHVRAGTKAPRASVNAYLDECRRLSEKEKKSAIWTAIWLGLAVVFTCGLILFAGLIAAMLPWVFGFDVF